MTDPITTVVVAAGYFVIASIAGRILMWGDEDMDALDRYAFTLMAGLLWPVLAMMGAFLGLGWLAWHVGDLPAAMVRRISEGRKLRKARRIERLREAERILAEHGLDFTP